MTGKQSYVIGLDCGTGGARALVTDFTGHVHGQAEAPADMRSLMQARYSLDAFSVAT